MMTKVKLISFCACCLIMIIAFAPQANATPITVSFSSTGLGPLTFHADKFSLSGESAGTLTLDSVLSVSQIVNKATFTVGFGASGTENLTLSYFLTVDGVTHTVSQSATWLITDPGDDFITLAASAPVLFVTGAGSWEVTLDAYAFPITASGTSTLPTPATFTPTPFTSTPEPASIMLFGTGLIAIGGLIRNGRKRSGSS
jgi:PEP-CTERM motif